MSYKDKQKQKEAQHKSYLKNKNKIKLRSKKKRRENKKYVHSKKNKCCKCGYSDKASLDFHHLRNKDKTIAQLIRNAASFDTIDLEIAKCEVICANCHRKEHLKQTIETGQN